MINDNLIEFFEKSFKNNWDHPAFTDFNDKSTYTYAQVAERIAELHLLFDAMNIKPAAKIALIGRNNPNWCMSALAVLTYGSVLVPILQDFHADDVRHIINHSESELLFCSDFIWESLNEDVSENVRCVFSVDDFRVLQSRGMKNIKEMIGDIPRILAKKYPSGFTRDSINYLRTDNAKVVLINYTSGTTGFSKGVMLTGNNLAGNIRFAVNTELIQPGCNHLSFLPLAHAYGCAFDFLYAVSVGAHITLLGKTPSPQILLRALADVKPGIVLMVPLIIEKLYKKQILPGLNKPSVKLLTSIPGIRGIIYSGIRKKLLTLFGGNIKEIIIGGAALNQEVEDFLHKIKFPYTVGYGMTECAPIISFAHFDRFIPHSAGRITEHMEVRIDSEDPYNEVGEIQVKGDHVMKAYYKNKEATKDVFTDDGWLRTGDLGTIDENQNIFIKGRSKNVILGSNGQNIYPEELESKLNNMPYVAESLIMENNGKLIALVYPDYDLLDSMGMKRDDLPGIMNDNLTKLNKSEAVYKNVAEIRLYPSEFEKTPKKSIKRFLYESIAGK